MVGTNDDAAAFGHVLGRLEGDVGGILKAVLEGRVLSGDRPHVPFWALARTMFPIAESIADLVYRSSNTAEQLVKVLATEFEAVRPAYKGVAATLTLMYRHSLAHQDELRLLKSKGRTVFWKIGIRDVAHLAISKDRRPNDFTVQFNLVDFYEDLTEVIMAEQAKAHGGKSKDRYKEWGILDLDAPKPKTRATIDVRNAAAVEIAAFR